MSKDQIKKVPPKKMALGRGLNSLLGGVEQQTPNFEDVAKEILKSKMESKEQFNKPKISFSTSVPVTQPEIEKKLENKIHNTMQHEIRAEISEPKINLATTVKAPEEKSNSIQDNKESNLQAQVAASEAVSSQKLSEPAQIVTEGSLKNNNASEIKAQTPNELRVWNIRIDKIKGNKEQPRKVFTDEALTSLSLSIKEKGILQPITVRRRDVDEYEIIAGERRWRAAQLAGLQEVPVLIKDVDDATSLELALIENIQRENLNPIEEAEAYFYLIKKYKLTQQELGEKIGRDRATVANVLRLLNLAPEVRRMVASNEISMGQAKAIMAISDPQKQKNLAIKARDLQLSVRAVEKMVQKFKEEPLQNLDVNLSKDKAVAEVKSELQRMLGTKVHIDYNLGKGKISIAFYSDDEFNQIIEKIRESWKTR